HAVCARRDPDGLSRQRAGARSHAAPHRAAHGGGAEMSHWRIAGPARALAGETRVPGDKSIGHRAVMFAALSDGRVKVTGLSGGEDNRRTVAALAALGVPIVETGAGALEVQGAGLDGLRA